MFYDNYVNLCNSVKKAPSTVAVEIGFKKSSVTRWKNGSTPTDASIRKIADYFGVTVGYLLGTESPEKPGEVAERKVSPLDFQAAFWGGDKNLSAEDKAALWRDVEEYARFKAEQMKNKK